MDNAIYIWDYLLTLLKNEYGVAGLMGNLYAESGLRPTDLEGKYEKRLGFTDSSYTSAVDSGAYTNFVNDSAGYGIAQWTYHTRKEALLDYAKQKNTSIGDLKMQLDFLWKELQNYKSVKNTLLNAKSVREASDAVMLKYEVPANLSEENQARRAAFGQKYYEMFAVNKEVIYMEENISKVINIAIAEDGYLEKKSASSLDDKTANAGSGNYTKYARDLDSVSWFNGKKQSAAWCAVFVSWCFYQAFGRELGKAILFQPDKDNCAAGCSSAAGYYKTKSRFYSEPQAGDQIFFYASSGSGYGHTGLVEKVENGKVYTIEGNTSSSSDVVPNGGAVRRKSYDLINSRIAGYGRPQWEIVGDNPIVPADKPVAFENYLAKVTANSGKTVNLRKAASTKSTVLYAIPVGDFVVVTGLEDNEWAHVSYTQDSGTVLDGYMMREFLVRLPDSADGQGENAVIERAGLTDAELTEIESHVSEALAIIQKALGRR